MPPVPYFGGKITAAPRIVATFPPHGHYVEPFAGSLAELASEYQHGQAWRGRAAELVPVASPADGPTPVPPR